MGPETSGQPVGPLGAASLGPRLAEAMAAWGYGLDQLARVTGLKAWRLRALGLGEGAPLAWEEAHMLALAFRTESAEVMAWAGLTPDGLADEDEILVPAPFWGTVGVGLGLRLEGAPLRPAPKHLVADGDGWAWLKGEAMAAAGLESGSRLFLSRVGANGAADGAVVVAEHPQHGAVCRRLRVRDGWGVLSAEGHDEPGPPPTPLAEGWRLLGVVRWARRPDLRL